MIKEKRIPLIKRWKEDSQLSIIVYNCKSCMNRGDGIDCKIFGYIPDWVIDFKKTCDKFVFKE